MPLIAVDLIDIHGGLRPEPPGVFEAFTARMATNGLLNPITVYRNPLDSDRFVVIAGRRRLRAAQRLGWKQISCTIRTYEAIEVEMLEITENFDRLELSTAQRDEMVIRYAELLRTLQTQQAVQDDANAATIARNGPTVTPPSKTYESGIKRYKRREPEVIKAVVQELGVSERTAHRILRRADAFDDVQRDILIRAGIKDVRLDRITAIDDPEKRGWVIDLLAQGLSYADAMSEVLEGEFTRGEDDLSDEEWLATLELSSQKVDQQRFRADALLYRRVQRRRIAFSADVDWTQLKAKTKDGGIYFRRLAFLLDCPHPRQWIKCSGCTAGMVGGKEHQACRSGGYLLG